MYRPPRNAPSEPHICTLRRVTAEPRLVRGRPVDAQLAFGIHVRILGAGFDANVVDALGLKLADTERVVPDPDARLLLPESRVVKRVLVEARGVAKLRASTVKLVFDLGGNSGGGAVSLSLAGGRSVDVEGVRDSEGLPVDVDLEQGNGDDSDDLRVRSESGTKE